MHVFLWYYRLHHRFDGLIEARCLPLRAYQPFAVGGRSEGGQLLGRFFTEDWLFIRHFELIFAEKSLAFQIACVVCEVIITNVYNLLHRHRYWWRLLDNHALRSRMILQGFHRIIYSKVRRSSLLQTRKYRLNLVCPHNWLFFVDSTQIEVSFENLRWDCRTKQRRVLFWLYLCLRFEKWQQLWRYYFRFNITELNRYFPVNWL